MKSLVKKIMISTTIFLTIGITTAQAQKGVLAGGLNYALAFNTKASMSGLAPKLQYYLSNHFRAEAAVTVFPQKEDAFWDASVYAHYLIDLNDKASIYPILGVGLLTDISKSGFYGSIGTSFGGGIEYDLSEKISVNAELKYKSNTGADYGWLTIGLAYKFKGL